MLQELLEKNQITQQALAEKLNVSQQAVSKWNKRISTPTISSFRRERRKETNDTGVLENCV